MFANPTALRHLLLLLLPKEGGGVSLEDSARLALNPSQWREAFRRQRWPTVVLSGPIGEYRPLLDHLLISPDWHLASVTNHGYLFRHGPGLPPRALEETFHFGPDNGTALYLAQIAGYYEAIRRTGDARACLERALRLAPENTSVLSHAANFAVAQRRWQDAIAHSERLSRATLTLAMRSWFRRWHSSKQVRRSKRRSLLRRFSSSRPMIPILCFFRREFGEPSMTTAAKPHHLKNSSANAKTRGSRPLIIRSTWGKPMPNKGLAESALRSYRAALESGPTWASGKRRHSRRH